MDEFFKASLMLDQWDHLSHAECEEIARDLGKELPGAFRFHKVRRCALADQQHHIAFFEWDGPPESYDHVFFALIPGGEATLGYDRDHPFVPNRQQQESWADETLRTGMFNETLDVFLDLVMTPFRHVIIGPFLLEVLATPLSPAPVFDETLGDKGGWRRSPTPISYEKTFQRISRQGFCFPASDEWEYACKAGSRTLFRWGNMTPSISIPLLKNQKAAGWDLHLQQNAFWLFIARQPYHWEFSAERGIMRGGNGGTALHTGAGTSEFVSWEDESSSSSTVPNGGGHDD